MSGILNFAKCCQWSSSSSWSISSSQPDSLEPLLDLPCQESCGTNASPSNANGSGEPASHAITRSNSHAFEAFAPETCAFQALEPSDHLAPVATLESATAESAASHPTVSEESSAHGSPINEPDASEPDHGKVTNVKIPGCGHAFSLREMLAVLDSIERNVCPRCRVSFRGSPVAILA